VAKRVLGYARVSSEEQAVGTSLRDQQSAMLEYSRARRLPVPTFYVEAVSGIHERIERREQIQALMREVRAGDLVLCDKIDRWSRDPEFTYRSVREILAAGASFYAVGDACDPSTHEGDTMLNFRVLFAREEHKRIKQRMVGTRKRLRDAGYYVEGLPPLGYRRSAPRGTKGPQKNVLTVHADEAEQVREAFALCLKGRSVTDIAATLGLQRDRVFDALRNRVYLGEVQNTSGQWIKARHAAIISHDTFVRARDALAGRRNGPPPGTGAAETRDWILRDVARCGRCGAKMSAQYAGPKDKRRYYYVCARRCVTAKHGKNTGTFVPVRDVEAAADALVLARLGELRTELAREAKAKAPVTDATKRRAALRDAQQRKRMRYVEAFTDGHLTRDQLRDALAKVDASLLRLDAEDRAARKVSPLDDGKVRRAVLRRLGAIKAAWNETTPEEKRVIVAHLAAAVRLAAGKAPTFTWRTIDELAKELGSP
jgi:DNA invertase Pin-like site-specific DNA recombinase